MASTPENFIPDLAFFDPDLPAKTRPNRAPGVIKPSYKWTLNHENSPNPGFRVEFKYSTRSFPRSISTWFSIMHVTGLFWPTMSLLLSEDLMQMAIWISQPLFHGHQVVQLRIRSWQFHLDYGIWACLLQMTRSGLSSDCTLWKDFDGRPYPPFAPCSWKLPFLPAACLSLLRFANLLYHVSTFCQARHFVFTT